MMHNTENICFTCGSDPIACVCDSFPTTPFDQSYSFPQFVQGSSTSFSVADWSAPSTAFSQFSHPQFAGGPSEQWANPYPAQVHPGSQFAAPQVLPHPGVLTEATGEVVNANRKRGRGTTQQAGKKGSSQKKARVDPPMPPAPATSDIVHAAVLSTAPRTGGVAPIPAAPPSTPPVPAPLQLTYQSLVRKPRKSGEVEASDVWYGVAVLEGTACRPDDLDALISQPRMRARPRNCTHVACRYCAKQGVVKIYKITNGQTDTIRDHHSTCHKEEWRKEVVENQLKGWEKLSFKNGVAPAPSQSPNAAPPEPFTQAGFHQRIVQWIAHDDQALNVVENPLFRELLIYASASPTVLTDEDILHRTLANTILNEEYEREIRELREELKKALGRISFTCDMWSSQTLRSFFAITVHYTTESGDQKLELRSRLAQQFICVLEELGVLHRGSTPQVGCITLDNASNCDTMMRELEQLLKEKMPDVEFDQDGNHLHCFPHVVNIAVKHGLRALTEVDSEAPSASGVGVPEAPILVDANLATVPSESNTVRLLDEDDPSILRLDPINRAAAAAENAALQEASAANYAKALKDDPVKIARKIVTTCRSSTHRRLLLQKIIKDGNALEGGWDGKGLQLPCLELLRDVDTRWSSTYLMIDRLIALWPAVKHLLHVEKLDLTLSDWQMQVLQDIRYFLRIPHFVQSRLSSTHATSASMVLPVYERLINRLREACNERPRIAHGIKASISALEKYLSFTRTTRAYAYAMVVNPSIKFSWLEENWKEHEYTAAREWITEAMLCYRKAGRLEPETTQTTTVTPSSSQASSASGTGSLDDIDLELSIFSGESTAGNTLRRHGSESNSDREARIAAEDIRTVEDELARYAGEGIFTDRDMDILDYWERHKRDYPLLYEIAVTALAFQASSVTSERVFSSSKETDTLRRSKLGGHTMEMLQVVKYSLRSRRWESDPSRSIYVAHEDDLADELDGEFW
uniref:Lmo0415 protein n=1 Tax=Ganoderma boninense TaxID=34458 RepID=A0A5K1JU15_9APHY|nr:Lmo0415 protein [Ganoderma boninense]